MSACVCCPETSELNVPQGLKAGVRRVSLFNWLTVLLITGWVGIVTLAMQVADDSGSTLPPLETFLSTLI